MCKIELNDETKREILEALLLDSVTITFKKKDGSTRVMICTQQEHLIPAQLLSKEPITKSDVDVIVENIRVFDLEKEAWRSFNFSSLIRYEI